MSTICPELYLERDAGGRAGSLKVTSLAVRKCGLELRTPILTARGFGRRPLSYQDQIVPLRKRQLQRQIEDGKTVFRGLNKS